jgi:hypothetical protein
MVNGQLHAPAALPQGRTPGYALDRLVFPRAVMDTVMKHSQLPPVIEP